MILSIDNLNLSFGKKEVLHHFSCRLQKGEIACLLGHSGCGKTTVLRAIAGFERGQTGKITLNERTLSDEQTFIAPHLRNIGMVFQDYALFPHLTVADNIAFGISKWSNKTQRVAELLDLVGLPEYGKHYPHQLSGGQQQRIALARALAPKPELILLDEPFSNLDADWRYKLSKEVRQLLKHQGISALMVTHDQQEAFTIADKIGVMFAGKLAQWDTPQTLYIQPATPSVAQFIGIGQLWSVRAIDEQTWQHESGIHITHQHGYPVATQAQLLIRPDDIVIGEGNIQATVLDKDFKGEYSIYTLKINEHTVLLAQSRQDYLIGQNLPIRLVEKEWVAFVY